MLVFILRRMLMIPVLVLFVSSLTFLIIHLAPGDPVTYMYGPYNVSGEDMERLRRDLGLDRPLLIQYINYVGSLVRGDLGYSYLSRRPVLRIIQDRLPATITLMISAFIFATVLGLIIGTISAVRARSVLDYAFSAVALIGYSMPTFWLGIVLVLAFSLHLGWFPTIGMRSLGSRDVGLAGLRDLLHHLVLPTITLGSYYLGTYARLQRASMLEVLQQDYLRTARAKGLSESIVVAKHAARNALLPVVTVSGLQMGLLFGGAVLTETVFAWPGLGRLTYDAILQRDYPLLLGLLVLVCLAVVLANLLTDILYSFIDPRIHISENAR